MLREPPRDDLPDDGGDDAAPSVTDVLRAALAPLATQIDAAFVYGPRVTVDASGHGDLDVMVIGRGLVYAEVLANFIAAAKFIGRTIHPSVYAADEWTRKLTSGNRVALAIMKQRKVYLLGADDRISLPR